MVDKILKPLKEKTMSYKRKPRPPVFTDSPIPKKPGDLILTSSGWVTVK